MTEPTIVTAAADVLQVAGFVSMANDVRSGKASPQASIYYALKWPGRFREQLLAAQKLVGKPSLDVRRYVETGKKRYI